MPAHKKSLKVADKNLSGETKTGRKESISSTSVKGGVIAREIKTGRFVAVKTSSGRKLASKKSSAVVKVASTKRKSALKRLADR